MNKFSLLIASTLLASLHCHEFESKNISLSDESNLTISDKSRISPPDNINKTCRLGQFPEPAPNPKQYYACTKFGASSNWVKKNRGSWILRTCPGRTWFYVPTRTCKSERYVRRQQNLCRINEAFSWCQLSKMFVNDYAGGCKCLPEYRDCSCGGQNEPNLVVKGLSVLGCPPTLLGSLRPGEICSLHPDHLVPDPIGPHFYLQCHPIASDIYCGRWMRRPCAPGTIFSVELQVCVHDPARAVDIPPVAAAPPPPPPHSLILQGPPPAILQPLAYAPPSCFCGCQLGVPVGQCGSSMRCPNQSVCQIFPAAPLLPACHKCIPTCCFHNHRFKKTKQEP